MEDQVSLAKIHEQIPWIKAWVSLGRMAFLLSWRMASMGASQGMELYLDVLGSS